MLQHSLFPAVIHLKAARDYKQQRDRIDDELRQTSDRARQAHLKSLRDRSQRLVDFHSGLASQGNTAESA